MTARTPRGQVTLETLERLHAAAPTPKAACRVRLRARELARLLEQPTPDWAVTQKGERVGRGSHVTARRANARALRESREEKAATLEPAAPLACAEIPSELSEWRARNVSDGSYIRISRSGIEIGTLHARRVYRTVVEAIAAVENNHSD